MTRLFAISLAVGGAMTLALPAVAQGPSGAMLGNTCAGCHGTNGSSVGPASPNIAGFTEEYFTQAMVDYKTGARNSTIMGRIARGYSDADIAAMAKFFAKQPLAPKAQMVDEAAAGFGLQLHEVYCGTCHTDKGRANGQGPILAGQWVPYTKYSLRDMSAGLRPSPAKMNIRVRELHMNFGDAGIDAVAQYYGSLK